jgi:transposase
MLTSGGVLFQHNARPHTAACTRALLEHFYWELFERPSYSPDLAPSNYHLFIYLRSWLGSQCFNSNEELIEGIKMWLSSQAADFFEPGIKTFSPLRQVPQFRR